jgi:hypothetical protein
MISELTDIAGALEAIEKKDEPLAWHRDYAYLLCARGLITQLEELRDNGWELGDLDEIEQRLRDEGMLPGGGV